MQIGAAIAKMLVFVVLGALLPLPLYAQRVTGVLNFYVSPDGNDANNCRTRKKACKNLQVTYGKIVSRYDFQGQAPTVHLADGSYPNVALDVSVMPLGSHAVTFIGNCGGTPFGANRNQVVINVPPGKPAFWVQDIGTLIVTCMKITGAGGTAFLARQHTILDAQWITFGELSQAFAITDHSIANVGGENWITGNMTVFAQANYHSTIRFMGVNRITEKVNIKHFILSYNKSLVEIQEHAGALFENPSFVVGQKYLLHRNGDIAAKGKLIPGNIPGASVDGTGRFYP